MINLPPLYHLRRENERIQKLVAMSEKVMHKIENTNEKVKKNENASTGSHCGKNNHTENSCFKSKTFCKCQTKGHIVKFCKYQDTETASLKLKNTYNENNSNKENMLVLAQRFLLKIKICEQVHEFLYDIGLQFTIIKRSAYDNLTKKRPIYELSQCGKWTNGSKFNFDGVVYLHIAFITENGEALSVKYESVFVSS